MAGFKVTRISEGPVKPASPTPEETLPLAWVDRYPTHRGLVESTHIFRSGADAAPAVIRAALGKALAFFYPLAGRIVEGDQPGCPAIRCTADGVYFAEAQADCSLEDVRFLEPPLLLPKEDLVPYPGDDRWNVEPHNTIMMMQVKAAFFAAGCICHLSEDFSRIILEVFIRFDMFSDIRATGYHGSN